MSRRDDDAYIDALDALAPELPQRDADALAAALAATAPATAPPAALRARLLARVRAEATHVPQAEPIDGIRFAFAGNADWTPTPFPGVFTKTLLTDPVRRMHRTLVRLDAGAVFPPHRHEAPEETLLLSGDLAIDGQEMVPGDYCIAATGTVHGALTTRGGAVIVAFACMDDAPVTTEEWQRARAAEAARTRPAG